MLKAKDFMNALVKVRNTYETVTVGRFTFTYLPASHERAGGIARCEYMFRRPVVGDRNEPQDGSVSVGGFAWASTSIVRMGRSFARDNAEMEAQHLDNQAAYLGDQIFEVEQHIEENLVDLSKCNCKAQQIGLRLNISRLERERDNLLTRFNRIDFERRKDAMDRLDVLRENATGMEGGMSHEILTALIKVRNWCHVEGCTEQVQIADKAMIAAGMKEIPCFQCEGLGEWDEGPLPARSSAQISPEYRQVKCQECNGTGKLSLSHMDAERT